MVGQRIYSKNFWLTIKDVEQLLGWHRSKVRRWMKAGKLPFVRDHNRYARFPRREIELFAGEEIGRIVHGPPGKVTAKAFALFAQGKTWQEVTIALGREPTEAQSVEVVRKLHEQFLDQDKRPSSGMLERGGKGPSEPEVEDGLDDELPVADADEWGREQAKEARAAQAALEREECAWREEQRRREEERALRLRLPALVKVPAPPRPDDEAAPISERFAQILQMLAARKASE